MLVCTSSYDTRQTGMCWTSKLSKRPWACRTLVMRHGSEPAYHHSYFGAFVELETHLCYNAAKVAAAKGFALRPCVSSHRRCAYVAVAVFVVTLKIGSLACCFAVVRAS